jgi:hypothetical protein
MLQQDAKKTLKKINSHTNHLYFSDFDFGLGSINDSLTMGVFL